MTDVESSITERLPAYVAGRLPREQAFEIETAAQGDPSLAAEIELYRSMRREVRGEAMAGVGPGELGWARLARAMADRPSQPARRYVRPWQIAAAAMALIVMVESALLIAGLFADRQLRYFPVEEAASPAGPTIKVALAPQVRERELREFLVSLNARIVDGPSALGFYTLRFFTAGERAAALEAFRHRPDVVESVLD